jgi:8-oxo-dGTP pyrophosphatase MutT (NUDIX family)
MDRHLTVSGFVVHERQVALHWHRRIGAWLPAGGHIEPGEDPVEAVLREVTEEFAVDAEVMRFAPGVEFTGGASQIAPPFTILLENVDGCGRTSDGKAVHIDLIYLLRLTAGYPGVSYDAENPIHWFTAEEIATGSADRDGADVPLLADVVALGLEALRVAALNPALVRP